MTLMTISKKAVEKTECRELIELSHNGSVLSCYLRKGHGGPTHFSEGTAQGGQVYKIAWPNKRKGGKS